MSSIQEKIQTYLSTIADEKHVKIFYACESGSRAWGFPSADSDYDVRFLYLRQEEWYLSINVEKKRDVIETMIESQFDLCGWDLRKALGLLRKSNAALLEWLASPIVYMEEFTIAATMRKLARQYHSPRACFWHYLGMAKTNFHKQLTGEYVKAKQYLYVLRPLLAARWIENGLGLVPMEFETLVSRLVDSPELKTAIEKLIAEKQKGLESDPIPRIAIFHDFIEREFARFEKIVFAAKAPVFPLDELNDLFRMSLRNVWS